MEKIFLPGEEVVVHSEDKKTILTNMRLLIRKKKYSNYLFLESISSIEVNRFGDWSYMLTALVFVFVTEQFVIIPMENNNNLFIGIQLTSCLIIIILWLLYHRATISISSIDGKILKIMVNRKAIKGIPDFIYKIQTEKNNRLSKIAANNVKN